MKPLYIRIRNLWRRIWCTHPHLVLVSQLVVFEDGTRGSLWACPRCGKRIKKDKPAYVEY